MKAGLFHWATGLIMPTRQRAIGLIMPTQAVLRSNRRFERFESDLIPRRFNSMDRTEKSTNRLLDWFDLPVRF